MPVTKLSGYVGEQEELRVCVQTLEQQQAEGESRNQELEGHKEQVKQHAVTICALEER